MTGREANVFFTRSRPIRVAFIGYGFAIAALTIAFTAVARADYPPAYYGSPQYDTTAYGPVPPGPAPCNPLADPRNGGVLEESYNYQRGGPPPGLISPATGWYHYGFPVTTFRWGWFGAEHYYPTVWWHHGYYDDYCRFGYRCGY